jgi:endo-1,4-beta-xylanase
VAGSVEIKALAACRFVPACGHGGQLDLRTNRVVRDLPAVPGLRARQATCAPGTLVRLLTLGALACGPNAGAGGKGGSWGGAGDTGHGGVVGGDGGAPGGGSGGAGAEAGGAGGPGGAGDSGGGGGDGDGGVEPGDGGTDAAPAITLRTGAERTARLFGAAVRAAHLSDGTYTGIAASELSYVTPENEMKWDATEPMRDVFTFDDADAIVAFAAQHGIKVKGHTLVWHSQLPAWVAAITDPTDLRNAMLSHVAQMVAHFRGKVVAWDVVNEAWADNGQALRNTIFRQVIGDSYIDDAFYAARATDPGARLYYNDYGAEGMGAKSDAIYDMVKGMRARGVPIDGVGLQMHTGATDTSPTAADLAANMKRLADLGLEVVISEMDVQICNGDLDAQSRRFHDIVAVCVAQPACAAVTVWGIPDKYSWRNGQSCATPRPLLFDDNYVPKPAHAAVIDALYGR